MRSYKFVRISSHPSSFYPQSSSQGQSDTPDLYKFVQILTRVCTDSYNPVQIRTNTNSLDLTFTMPNRIEIKFRGEFKEEPIPEYSDQLRQDENDVAQAVVALHDAEPYLTGKVKHFFAKDSTCQVCTPSYRSVQTCTNPFGLSSSVVLRATRRSGLKETRPLRP